MRTPDFKNNILKVLKGEVPDRPTLFEFFLNDRLYNKLAGEEIVSRQDSLAYERKLLHAYKNAGYDYVTLQGSNFNFPAGDVHREKSISLNEGAVISDRESFNKYSWPDPDSFDYGCI